MHLPQQQITKDVLLEKYAKGNETTQEEIFLRVAKHVASVEDSVEKQEFFARAFYANMTWGAIGAGRIMSSAGTNLNTSLLNCYVVDVGDSIDAVDESGSIGIYEALRQAACTMQKGGGVGYNFSKLRPKGSWVKSVASEASGPCSYIDIFDASCKTIECAGNRRGAQLGALDISHPDILEFIEAKRTKGRWNNFNVSVVVTDEFMKLVETQQLLKLIHKAKPSEEQLKKGAYYDASLNAYVYSTIPAAKLWDIIMTSNYEYAEPGILFFDTINKNNNLHYTELLNTTNPCGEVPIPPNGCCNLGPIILPKLVSQPFTKKATFKFETLGVMTQIHTRFLDNVLDATIYPLEQQRLEALSKRRIGVGFTGLANCLAMMNVKYGSPEGLALAERIVKTMYEAAYTASAHLAEEKGRFPLYNEQILEEGTTASRLPDSIKLKIKEHGLRNSHLLSIAPTGTVSLAFADNASNGIEPPFSLAYQRKKRMGDGSTSTYNVLDHAFRVYLSTIEDRALADKLEEAVSSYKTEFTYNGTKHIVKHLLPDSFVTATELSPKEHIDMMKVIQPYVCQSISKTINVDVNCNFEDFKDIYYQSWKAGLKGISTYRPNDILGSVLSVGTTKKEEPSTTDTMKPEEPKDYTHILNKLHHTALGGRLDGMLTGITIKDRFFTEHGEQKFLLTINFKDVVDTHTGITISRPVEFLLTSSFTNSASVWQSSMRFMSLMARSGVSIPKIIENMKEVTWEHGKVRLGYRVKGDRTTPMWHGSDVAAIGYVIEEALKKDGYLDTDGNINLKTYHKGPPVFTETTRETLPDVVEVKPPKLKGKTCPDCGDNALIKKDGCESCSNCGYIGSCG